jgi:2,3-bisphosphoglycerate-independent phosphoglycerate mutase
MWTLSTDGAVVARALPLEEDPDQENAQRTAAALNKYLQWVHRCLREHPINQQRQALGLPLINFLFTKWAGVRPQVPPFHEQNGLRAASIAGSANVLVDKVKAFHERAAIYGSLGRIYGADLMPILLNLTDRIRLHGVRHQRQARPYWPQQIEPFTVREE